MDELTDDDRASDVLAFIVDFREELREEHPELLDSDKDLMEIQSEKMD